MADALSSAATGGEQAGVAGGLAEFLRTFHDDEACLEFLWLARYSVDGDHAECPRCRTVRRFKRYRTVDRRRSWTCTSCGKHLSPTTGTIFEKSSIGLRRWFHAAYLVASVAGTISIGRLELELHVTHKTAWRMRTLLSAAFGVTDRTRAAEGAFVVGGVDFSVLVPTDVRSGVSARGPDRRRSTEDRLPVYRTSFLGRRRELTTVRRLLRQSQLVTLVGSGGCGKTRLAVEVGRSLRGVHPDGVWWVDLQRLPRGESVAAAVGAALGLREQPGAAMLDVLRRRLGDRRALIILDNCEHVLDSCAEVMEHLLATTTLRLLATSREAVSLPAEVVWQVPSLPMPRHYGTLTQLGRVDAVRLFTERTRAADPSFRLDETNVAAVAHICRQLDGIPLAIELAAALAPALRPQEITAALDDCLRLLTGGSRAGIPRHRTLCASMEWSHALLGESEQILFRRLAVFPDSFSLEAAQSVCTDALLTRGDVVPTLASLVRRSLVTVDVGRSTSRYRLLQTVRQYASDRLAEAGETTIARDQHLAYAIALVEREPAPDLREEWLGRLDEERGGMRAALDWAIERGDRAAPLRLASGLGLLFHVRAYLAEGRRFFADALVASDSAPSRQRAQALWGSAYVAFAGMDIPVAVAQATAAVQVARTVGDSQTAARALTLLGGARMCSEPQQARKYLEEAILLAGAAGDNWCLTLALGHTGQSYLNQNKLEPANRYAAEAAEVMEPRNRRFQAWSAAVRSSIAVRGGDLAAARQLADHAGTLAAEVGDPNCQAWTALSSAEIDCWRGRARQALDTVDALAAQLDSCRRAPTVTMRIHAAAGTCALALGELTRAETDLTRSVTIAREISDSTREAASAVDLAEIALLRGQHQDARAFLEVVAQRAEFLDDAWLSAAAKVRRARAARMSGDLAAARDLAYEALALQRAGGYQLDAVSTLETLVGLHLAMGNPTHAARLTGAATAARRRLGARRSRLDDLRHRPDRIGLVDALDPAALRNALAEGGQLTLVEAIAYSMRGRGKRARPATGWQSLTPTEVAIARLVAQGCTNPEIARRMFISRATVKKHLSQIFAKTGIAHRAELAAQVGRQPVGEATAEPRTDQPG